MMKMLRPGPAEDAVLSHKKQTRKEILGKLRSHESTDILKKSNAIKKKLFAMKEFRKARCVVFFVSMPEEVDTHRMIDECIAAGKDVGVPVTMKGKSDLIVSRISDRLTQLEIGPYGVQQPRAAEIRPIPREEMDLVVVPGVAFDRDGNRLGRGKGYYDRFLEALPSCAATVGLCFDFQVLDSIPVLPHDIPVKMLLTN
ncbi:MAG: 5-formyltetrahydrofolate cyclo-ligase [Candidatus Omnitrophota bacterium]